MSSPTVRRGVTAALLAMMTLAAVMGCNPGKQTAESVKIAVNLPLTGPQAAYSGEYPLGLRMGIEEGARARGIDPKVFVLDIQDNTGSARDAVAVYQRQKLSGFDAYVSGLSTSSLAIASDLDQHPASSLLVAFDAAITEAASNRFRVLPSYRTEAPKYIEYAAMRGAKRIFMLTMNVSSTEDQFARLVEPELARLGIEFKRERFDIATSDYRTLALKAVAYEPDLVFVSGLSFDILPIVQSLQAQGIVKDGNVLCCMDIIDLLSGAETPRDLIGVAFTCPAFELPGALPGEAEWRRRYLEYGGKVPNYVQAYAYDTGRLLVEAYAKARSLSPEALASVFPYNGVCGTMSLNAHRDLETDLRLATIDQNGKRVPIEPAAN